jgi:hypothetical protein
MACGGLLRVGSSVGKLKTLGFNEKLGWTEPTVYFTLLVVTLPARSTAVTLKLCAPIEAVLMRLPFGTPPEQLATPEIASVQA